MLVCTMHRAQPNPGVGLGGGDDEDGTALLRRVLGGQPDTRVGESVAPTTVVLPGSFGSVRALALACERLLVAEMVGDGARVQARAASHNRLLSLTRSHARSVTLTRWYLCTDLASTCVRIVCAALRWRPYTGCMPPRQVLARDGRPLQLVKLPGTRCVPSALCIRTLNDPCAQLYPDVERPSEYLTPLWRVRSGWGQGLKPPLHIPPDALWSCGGARRAGERESGRE